MIIKFFKTRFTDVWDFLSGVATILLAPGLFVFWAIVLYITSILTEKLSFILSFIIILIVPIILVIIYFIILAKLCYYFDSKSKENKHQ